MHKIVLCVIIFTCGCANESTPPARKTRVILGSLTAMESFCSDEVRIGDLRSDDAECVSKYWDDGTTFFVKFNSPKTVFPWTIQMESIKDQPTPEQSALIADADLALLEDLGINLDNIVSRVAPIRIITPNGEDIPHSFVTHFKHEIDGIPVYSDRSFISRSLDGSVRSIYFRWNRDAMEQLSDRSLDEIKADDVSLRRSLDVAAVAAEEMTAAMMPDISIVWLPVTTGIEPGVVLRWTSIGPDDEGAMGVEQIFLDGQSIR